MGQTNYSTGHEAEKYAAAYLKKLGYKIVEVNWSNRFCEIDIIAKKEGAVYFVEVKYRKSPLQGQGLDYITPQKLKQMQFAAAMWVHECRWEGAYDIAAIEMTGQYFTVTNFLPNIT